MSAPLILAGSSVINENRKVAEMNAQVIQANTAAVRAAANSIDILVSDHFRMTLYHLNPTTGERADGVEAFGISGGLYINSDDGVITMAFPDKIETSIAGADYEAKFDYVSSGIQTEVVDDAIITGGKFGRFELSEQSGTGCYLYADFDAEGWHGFRLHIPAGAERVGALVSKNDKYISARPY